MKYLVLSDIHGSNFYADKINDIYNSENPDKIILLGDLYYHGPRNPLTEQYDPMRVNETLNKYKDIILAVRGNCDADVDEMISEFKFEDNIELNISGKRFFFTHGHKYNMDKFPNDIDVLVYGHLHTGFIKEEYGIIFVNSGSLSLPKDGTVNSYLIIDDEYIILKDVQGKELQKRNFIK